jgi:hypothetical protein
MMKLLVQGDDFGFTKGVTAGIIDAIDNGILRNTGLFTNMPEAKNAVKYMADRPHVCFGIDFNIVSGRPVSDPKDVPHLVDENGEFIRSVERLKAPRYKTEEGRREMFPADEVNREIKAQYDRFIELAGKKPGYLHGHSLQHEHYMEAIYALSDETGIPYSHRIQESKGFSTLQEFRKFDLTKKNTDLLSQLDKKPLDDFMEHADYFLTKEYVSIGGHPGFVDAELLTLTTLSLERIRDNEMMTSDRMKNWVRENNVELITYYDLYK